MSKSVRRRVVFSHTDCTSQREPPPAAMSAGFPNSARAPSRSGVRVVGAMSVASDCAEAARAAPHRSAATSRAQRRAPRPKSDRETDVEDVAIADKVLFSLEPEPSLFPRPGQRAGFQHLLVGDDLGPDEAAGEVAVDGAGRLERGGVPAYG